MKQMHLRERCRYQVCTHHQKPPCTVRVTVYVSRKTNNNSHFFTSILSAFSETLACEVAPFNINVLIFEPGGFRSRGTIEGGIDTSNPIPDYNDTRENMLEMRKRASEVFRGDPRKLMEFLVDVIKSEGKAEGKPLPKYLVCGPGANEGLLGKCEIMRNAVDEWRWVTKELLLDSP
jgi:hypothetical protein